MGSAPFLATFQSDFSEECMIGMGKRGLHLVVMVLLLVVWGCDSSGRKSKDTSQRGTELAFVEASTGLPTSGQWRHSLAFHDMNGDGNLDILATPRRAAPEGETAVPVVWYGNGKGEWTRAVLDVPSNVYYDYGSIAVADFDGDGIADIGLAMHGLGLRALKGQKEVPFVNFSSGIPPQSDFPTRVLTAADFNNDGIADIAAFREYVDQDGPSPYGGLLWCTFEGGPWKCRGIGDKKETTGLVGDQIVVGDVDNDGNKDLAVSSFNHRITKIVWLGDGKGGFRPFNTGLIQEKHYNSVALADVNRDGRDDLIASVSSFGDEFKGVKVFISGPDGFSDMSEGLPSGEESWGYLASAGDLDGDGAPEIIAVPQAGGLRVYSLKGNQWHEVKTSGLPDKGLYRTYNIYCIDINKDGQKDIVVIYADSNDDSGGIRIFLNASEKK